MNKIPVPRSRYIIEVSGLTLHQNPWYWNFSCVILYLSDSTLRISIFALLPITSDYCRTYRPETSVIFLLLGTWILFVLFYIYPIVPYAPEFLHISCYLSWLGFQFQRHWDSNPCRQSPRNSKTCALTTRLHNWKVYSFAAYSFNKVCFVLEIHTEADGKSRKRSCRNARSRG